MMFTNEIRLELHEKLKEITPHVYYNPPLSIKMAYPCIVYARTEHRELYANSQPYLATQGIRITMIHTCPEKILDMQVKLKELYPLASWQNDNTTSNLCHSNYVIRQIR